MPPLADLRTCRPEALSKSDLSIVKGGKRFITIFGLPVFVVRGGPQELDSLMV